MCIGWVWKSTTRIPIKLLLCHSPQLVEFITAEDVSGGTSTEVDTPENVTPAPEEQEVVDSSGRLLLVHAIGTKDFGIFEAAVNFVVGRCKGVATEKVPWCIV